MTGGDLFEIQPEVAFTAADLNWNDKHSRSTVEMNDAGSRPVIAGRVEDMTQYGTCVHELAEKYGVKMQEIALAWHWAKGVATPIVGATKAKYLDDAAAALSVRLTAEDIAYLEEPYVPHRIVGAIDHNPPQGVALLDEKKK